MVKFMEVSSIGVSKESQLRAAKILGVISDGCETIHAFSDMPNIFQYVQDLMTERWEKLRDVVKRSDRFILAKYPLQYCNFSKDFTATDPPFAWLKYKKNEQECAKLSRGHEIITRMGGFGSDPGFVRMNMLSSDDEFNLFKQLAEFHQGWMSSTSSYRGCKNWRVAPSSQLIP